MKLLIILFFIWELSVHAEIGRDLNSSLLLAYAANQPQNLVQSLDSHSLNTNSSFAFDGDMRFRYISFFEEQLTQALQLRVRASLEGRINPRLSWRIKLASGGHVDNYRPLSHYNQNQFVGGFDGKPLWLSSAYVSYSPLDNAVLKIGKLDRIPFLDSLRWNPLWDEDLAPEGVSAHYQKSVQNRYTFDLKTSWFFVNPVMPQITAGDDRARKNIRSSQKKLGFLLRDEWFSTQNTGMFSATAQALMSSRDYDLRTGLNYHNVQTKGAFSKTERNSTTLAAEKSSEGESASPDPQEQRKLMYNYSVIDLFLQMNIKSIRVYPVPLSVSVQLTQNFGAESNITSTENFGFVVGGVLGHFQRAGHLNFGYHFFQLPKDVTLSHFVDSDIGGTGYTGHQLSARYYINKDMAFDFKYIMKMDSIKSSASLLHQGFVSVLINI